jgi:hypothetical protein
LPSMSETAARRLEIALDLADLAPEIYEAKVRREAPGLSDAEVAKRVTAWLRTRPGAEDGDAEGRPVAWPRRDAVGG